MITPWEKLPRRIAILLSAFIFVHAHAASDWPQFRGPTGQGISAATNLPVFWSATSNVVWKTPIPGQGWSSPVLAKNKIYLTTAITGTNDSSVSLRALCLDAITGKILWNEEVLQPDPEKSKTKHQKNGLASPTPIVTGEKLFVHFGHLGTAVLDLNGKILWRQTELAYPPTHGNGGSPALIGDALVFNCDAAKDPFVAALDVQDGRVRWKTPRNTSATRTFSFSTPLEIEVDGSRQMICPGSGFVAGYDPKDGKEIWRVKYGEGYSVVPRPLFAKGILFVCSGFDRPALFAIKPQGAKGDATESNVAWSYNRQVPNTPSPVMVNDEIYFVSDAGILTCLEAMTGKMIWSERLGGDFSSSPIYADGKIYFQNETGEGFVVKPGKTFEILAKNNLGERSLASSAVADGALFIRTESNLWRIGEKK